MQPLTVPPGKPVDLRNFDPDFDEGLDKAKGRKELDRLLPEIDHLSYRLFGEGKRALLVILQGMDTAGKDGVIRQVFAAVDPQTCHVRSFKAPSAEELAHDFLWRIMMSTPRRGDVGVFNRSHYEDVLVPKVMKLFPAEEVESRFDRINDFERILSLGQTRILKFFLHISKDEQKKRLQERLDNPDKRWKFDRADVEARKYWSQYQEVYNEILTRCNSDLAPWYIVPANKKWYRSLVVARVVCGVLKEMDPKFPPASPDLDGVEVD